MEYFIQQLINGITLGSIYGLIAIGYTMVYGIIGMINFAHGDIFMIGAFIALIAFILFGLTAMYLSCKHRDPTKIKGKLSEAVTIEMAIFFGGCIVAFGSLFVN